MEGWRLPGVARPGSGNPFLAGTSTLQPDDTWFGDPVAPSSFPPQFGAQKRAAPTPVTSLPSKAARLASDPSGRLNFEAPPAPGAVPARGQRGSVQPPGGDPAWASAGQPAVASAAPPDVRQVPSSALQAGRLSFDSVVQAPGNDETFAAEVWRITGIGNPDYRRVFDLQPSELDDLQLIQSKYRHIMRLLHPDKRRPEEEARAGGKSCCDLAVRLVQEAMAKAKKEALPDPQAVLKNDMRRMQEMQRTRARMAAERQMPRAAAPPRPASSSQAPAVPDMTSLLSDISQVLGGATASAAASPAAPAASNTTAQLISMLAGMRQGPGEAVDLT